MNFKEAVEELKKGKKIRKKSWAKDAHLLMEKDVIKSFIREAVPFTYDLTIINSNDWVVVDDDKEKQIEFADAIQELLKNKLVRLKEWPTSTYLHMTSNKKELYLSRLSDFSYFPTCEDFVSNDWEISYV